MSDATRSFVTGVSHELRTPLNAILGYAQLLATTQLMQEPRAREWLVRLQQTGWHLLAVIDGLPQLAGIDSGERLRPFDVGLRGLIDESVAMVHESAKCRRISIRHDVSEHAQRVHADPVRLRQVLVNLLSNAVKYNLDGGRIWVRTSATAEGNVEIDVEDTGLGMDPVQLDRLFRPFDRLGRELSPIEGCGIGLVIAKQLTELMGGTLRVRSTALCGTTFTLGLRAGPTLRPSA